MLPRLTIAEALQQAGQELQDHYDKAPIPGIELRRQAAQLGGHQESSILPSDFCYNRTNAGISIANKPMFVYEGRSKYRYVGMGYLYTGPIVHKPKGQAERIVGQWREGRLTML